MNEPKRTQTPFQNFTVLANQFFELKLQSHSNFNHTPTGNLAKKNKKINFNQVGPTFFTFGLLVLGRLHGFMRISPGPH
jgi:hypothetical protein